MDMHEDVKTYANRLAEKLDADIIYWNGPIVRPVDKYLIEKCIAREERKANVLLLMVTEGGDPDAAYRVARCLQEKYDRFYMYISGYCKSAGTLIALGAHELIMSDHGELGPIDAQMYKKDDMLETQSGLTVMDALSSLQGKAIEAFASTFTDIKWEKEIPLTSKMAAQIATRITTGLFTPLYGQIDPLHLGEAWRAMNIAGRYGHILLIVSENAERESLKILMTDYPSHGFVIDRNEAGTLFKNVRGPSDLEKQLAEALGDSARIPNRHIQVGSRQTFDFISDISVDLDSQEAEDET